MIGRPRAAYIHIPFCASKCWYCDFNSYAGLEPIFEEYVRELLKEIERAAPGPDGGLDSVYFGGGTPTVLDAPDVSAVLDAIRGNLGLADDCEATVEANPGTVDLEKLSQLRDAGFNRLSLGVQSFDDQFLRSIGRAHDCVQAIDAYEAARKAGFVNVGIDLIFALPGQDLDHWSSTLDHAVRLKPEHISLYGLTIEEGTRFGEQHAHGALAIVDEDTEAAMFELAIEKLTSADYEHYEVSNFAKPGYRSRHNATYWRNEQYFGFGAGATSYVDGARARRVAEPREYIAAIQSGSDAIVFSETLVERDRLGETVVMGLRVLEGVDLACVERETGFDVLSEYPTQIESLTRRGLIEIVDGRLRVTHFGLLLLNDVSCEFV